MTGVDDAPWPACSKAAHGSTLPPVGWSNRDQQRGDPGSITAPPGTRPSTLPGSRDTPPVRKACAPRIGPMPWSDGCPWTDVADWTTGGPAETSGEQPRTAPGRRKAASPETASIGPAIREAQGPDHTMGVMDSMRPRARSPQPGTSRPGVSSLGTSGAGGGPAKPRDRRPRRQVGPAIPPDRSRTRSTVRPITRRLPRPTAHRNPR